MASSYAAQVSASQVGSYFATQYYHVVRETPDFAHQFYTDASSVIRVDGESTETASALVQIHNLLVSLNFTSIEIKTINSLESWSGGVLVSVSGLIKSKDFNGGRKFVQTFLLAPQEKGYFVLNDVFHFIDDEFIDQSQAPLQSETPLDFQPTISDPVHEHQDASDYGLEVEAREYVESVHIEEEGVVEEYDIQEHHHDESAGEAEEEEAYYDESPALHQNVHVPEYVQEPLPVIDEPIVEEPKKFTYASILRAPTGKPAPAVTVRSAYTKVTPPVSEYQPPVQSYSAVPVQNSTPDTAPESFVNEEGDTKSVYVKNLPTSATTLEVQEEFKNFGKIKKDGVFLRNKKDVGVCFAFVEFEDAQSVVRAVQASPIQLGGRQVYIEERRANESSTSRGGGRRGGRGGRGGRYGGRGYGRSNYQEGGSNGFRG